MTPELKSKLAELLGKHAEEQPDIMTLRDILLKIGGHEILALPRENIDVQSLITDGYRMAYEVVIKPEGRWRHCHQDAQALALRDELDLCGGFTLGDEGIWVHHSWCLDSSNRIVEVTPEARQAYFGYRNPFAALRAEVRKEQYIKSYMAEKLQTYAQVKPEILEVRKILLNIGGVEVLGNPQNGIDLKLLIAHGRQMDYETVKVPSGGSNCLESCQELVRKHSELDLCSGFVLCKNNILQDAIWTWHHWCLRRGKNQIVETVDSTKYLTYFGYQISSEATRMEAVLTEGPRVGIASSLSLVAARPVGLVRSIIEGRRL